MAPAVAANSELHLMRSADIQATAIGDILSILLVCPDSHRVVANDLSSGRRCYENHDGTFVRLSSRNKLFARCECPADHWHSGFAERDDDHRWPAAPATAAEIWRSDRAKRQGFEAVVATAGSAAQGRAQYPAHHDRRP